MVMVLVQQHGRRIPVHHITIRMMQQQVFRRGSPWNPHRIGGNAHRNVVTATIQGKPQRRLFSEAPAASTAATTPNNNSGGGIGLHNVRDRTLLVVNCMREKKCIDRIDCCCWHIEALR
jgi:hypothetical protein